MNRFFRFVEYRMNEIIEENKIQKDKSKKRHKDFVRKVEKQRKEMDKNKIDINKWR